ncbi:DUF421 domain-containing protein [Brachybacterium huguangmaarense]
MDHMLSDLFALDMSVWEKVARTIGVYLALLVIIRLFGKRLMAQMNSLDLVVVLLLSNVVQNAVIGADNSLIGGVIGAVVLVVANWGLDVLSARVAWFDRVLNGAPTPLVTDGTPDLQALRRLSITRHELASVLRTQGAGSVAEVREAVIDPGGAVLVDIRPGDQSVSRADLETALASLREHIDARLDARA